jgi:hypothetical protein
MTTSFYITLPLLEALMRCPLGLLYFTATSRSGIDARTQ